MSPLIDIYHGSPTIVTEPVYGYGRKHNDYGRGFYCTQSEEIAKEWACSATEHGYANRYRIDLERLQVLRLNTEQYTVLNWMALLLSNRVFRVDTPIAGRGKRYLQEHFTPNVHDYDVIIGYRADDAYYDFADTFLNNGITVTQLARAMRLGRLGEQIVVRSAYAFEQLSYAGHSFADRQIYFPKRKERLDAAVREYFQMCEGEDDGLYLSDIVRGEVKNDDTRIPRNIP